MARSTPAAASPSSEWAGKDLGLPETGARSVARFGRRVVALIIDGVLTDLVAIVLHVYTPWADPTPGFHWGQLAVFAALQVLFIALLSGSFGHICVGLRVVPIRGGYVGVVRPLVRTVLLCLVVPALIWNRDQRGLHDQLAGTVLVRR